MRKIILKESELIKLIETAMDLDRYQQLQSFPTGEINKDTENAVEEIISKLKELLNMIQSGKKVNTHFKSKLYKTLDDINDTFTNIKYRP